MEKALTGRGWKHLEVQIIGDGTGAVNHLWERECSGELLGRLFSATICLWFLALASRRSWRYVHLLQSVGQDIDFVADSTLTLPSFECAALD